MHTSGASTKSCRRSAPATQSATRVTLSKAEVLQKSDGTEGDDAVAEHESGERGAGGTSLHRTTSRVTHLVCSTPGRFGPMRRTGNPWSM